MHYNFETKAAIGPSLTFMEVEGIVHIHPAAPETGKDAVWDVGGTRYGDEIVYINAVWQDRPQG